MTELKLSVQFTREYVLTKERSMRGGPIEHLRVCLTDRIGTNNNNRITMKDLAYTDCIMVVHLENMTYEEFDEILWQTLEDEFQLGKGTKNCKVLLEEIDSSNKRRVETNAIISQINSLIGDEDFKSLVKELPSIAPLIKNSGNLRIFSSQAYLFSIDDGCGLTQCLRLFGSLIDELGIFEFSQDNREIEVFIENNEKDPWTQINAISRFKRKIICIDISDFINDTENKGFIKMLRRLASIQKDYIYVFRVPYLEGAMLEQVQQAIYDVMYVRTVMFPQFTYKEYFLYLERALSRYKFKLASESWEPFKSMLMDERTKGNFYGFKTVNKMTNELIYQKMLNVAAGDENDYVITAKEFN